MFSVPKNKTGKVEFPLLPANKQKVFDELMKTKGFTEDEA